jgi:HEAT repeat protein
MRQRLADALKTAAAALVLVAALAMYGGARANGWEHGAIPLEALVRALEDGSASLRARAAQSLGVRGERETAGYLVELLAKPEPEPAVRSAIYLALGRIGNEIALPALTRALREETRDELRADCLTALGGIGSPLSVADVIAETAADRPILVRSAAVDALAGFAEKGAVDTLIEIAGDAANLPLGNRAIASLGKTGDTGAVPTLLALLKQTEDPFRQRLIARALGSLNATAAVPALEALAAGSSDHTVRIDATFALGTVRDGAALPTLIAALGDPHPAVIFTALRAILDLGDAGAADAVAAIARDIRERITDRTPHELQADFVAVYADMSVEVEALRVLADLDPATGSEAFLDAARATPLDAVDASIVLRIAEAVYERRRIAIHGLGYTRSDAARALLAGADGISDPDPRLRSAAVRALGVLGGSHAPATIAPMLADPNRDVRLMAARVLGLLGDAQSIAPLLPLLDDAMAGVRAEAAQSLGYLEADAARERLAALAADDPDAKVREAAAYALEVIGGR